MMPATEPTTNPHRAEALKNIQTLTELQNEYHAAIDQTKENERIIADAIVAEQDALHATDVDLEEQIELIIRTTAVRKALESRAVLKGTGVADALKRLAEEVMLVESWLGGVANHEALTAMDRIKLDIAKSLGLNPGKLSTGDLSLIRKSPVVLKWQALTLTSRLAQTHEIMAGRFHEGTVLFHAREATKKLGELAELGG